MKKKYHLDQDLAFKLTQIIHVYILLINASLEQT